jgi:[protein-PII] uridylyltransferase
VEIRDRLTQACEGVWRGLDRWPGRLAAARWTDQVDEAVKQAVETRLAPGLMGPGLAIVALGGYGRRDLSPFSDIDLLILHRTTVRDGAVVAGIEAVIRDLWDAGLAPSPSQDDVAGRIALARDDLTVHTALLEARTVLGDPQLAHDLRSGLARLTAGLKTDRFLNAAVTARTEERDRHGGPTLSLLQPDVKRSRGGLRDLHLMRWVARVVHGSAEPAELEARGLLSAADREAIERATDLLLSIRAELHLGAGRSQDVLSPDEQVRLAGPFGFVNEPGRLAVERFMQHYYRVIGGLDDAVERFVGRSRAQPRWSRLRRRPAGRPVEGGGLIANGQLALRPGAETAYLGDPAGAVRLFALAARYQVQVATPLRQAIRERLAGWDESAGTDLAPARRELVTMLATPGGLAGSLRAMHAIGLLGRLLPEFEPVRGLIQFNQVHRYTVDEHTLLCVANAERMLEASGPLGAVYREIGDKAILHLSLLVHDLGKGGDRDHSDVGCEIAEATAERFGLGLHPRAVLEFLVHKHLLMSRLAFRRDVTDPSLVADFARTVGTPEVLRKLYVLTAADTMSVSPETWTDWKAEILADFYARTLERLTGDATAWNAARRADEARDRLRKMVGADVPADWLEGFLVDLTPALLLNMPADELASHARAIHRLGAGDVAVSARYQAATRTTVYSIDSRDEARPGFFARITGVLLARGLQILDARLTTLPGGTVIDRFEVIDPDHRGEPPPSECRNEVAAELREVLLGRRDVRPPAPRRYGSDPSGSGSHRPVAETPPAPEVQIDNLSSSRYTIIDVFAADRAGLLHDLARTLLDLGLSVGLARVTTQAARALDVFYVTDPDGSKLTDESRLESVRTRLIGAITISQDRAAHS